MERQGVNLGVYFTLAKFANKIRMVATKVNVENVINVIEHLRILNMATAEYSMLN